MNMKDACIVDLTSSSIPRSKFIVSAEQLTAIDPLILVSVKPKMDLVDHDLLGAPIVNLIAWYLKG